MKKLMDMETHAKLTRQMKEVMDWDDLMPQLVANVSGSIVVVGFAVDREDLGKAVELAVAELMPIEVLYISDSYQVTAEEEEVDRLAGKLKDRFLAGDPDVYEAMVMYRYNGLRVDLKIMPYDRAKKQWLPEPEMDGGQIGGRIPDAMKDGWWEGMSRSHEGRYNG